MTTFNPMLSASLKKPSSLVFPVLASPKLDGVRAVVQGGKVLSRNLKSIANEHTAALFGRPTLEGLDGELLLSGPHDATIFRRTSGAVRRADGEPDVIFYVFDVFMPNTPFMERYAYLQGCTFPKGVKLVPHKLIHSVPELMAYEQEMLELGYEGVMIRSLRGPYKQGRSTAIEGYLLKLKRFEDAEAEIIGFDERMHNGNVATTNELGYTERSSHKENLVGRGDLGALVVRGINGTYAGKVFNIGTGFDDEERGWFWARRDLLKGQVVKYQYFPMGSKDAPRFPTYLGLRQLGT